MHVGCEYQICIRFYLYDNIWLTTGMWSYNLYESRLKFFNNAFSIVYFLGILHTGLGMTSVTALLFCMNIPGISSTSLKAREREVGVKVEKVAKETCDYFATKEKDLCE